MKDFKYYFLRSLPIILIIAIIAVFAMVSDMQEQVDELNNVKNEYNEEEDGLFPENNGNIYDREDEKISNEVEEDEEIKNTVTVSNVTVIEKNPSNITTEEREEISNTDNKQKAVDMVKAKYGDKMEYFCDSILSTGEFVVAAKMPSSSTVSAYYKVNIETGKISIMF